MGFREVMSWHFAQFPLAKMQARIYIAQPRCVCC